MQCEEFSHQKAGVTKINNKEVNKKPTAATVGRLICDIPKIK